MRTMPFATLGSATNPLAQPTSIIYGPPLFRVLLPEAAGHESLCRRPGTRIEVGTLVANLRRERSQNDHGNVKNKF